MSEQLDGMVIPKHVAMILDGNGRWAKKRRLPRSMATGGLRNGREDRLKLLPAWELNT